MTGIAGMDRALQANVIAKSGRVVETAGDIDTLLLDKTGTITIGNRKTTHFYAAPGVDQAEMIRASALSSLADETPEGKSIVELAGIDVTRNLSTTGAIMISFTAETRSYHVLDCQRRSQVLRHCAGSVCWEYSGLAGYQCNETAQP